VTLLVLSPDFASHYGPLAVVARAARSSGARVVVATGPTLRAQVERDGFEWTSLRLGAGSNAGVVDDDPAIRCFLAATADGPAATIRHQALARERDLLWEPERVATEVARICDDVEPDHVLVDHVSFGSTLAMYATGRPFVTLVPGHPSQLPVGHERYGIPATWPSAITVDPADRDELGALADRVTAAFTARWNDALAAIAPDRPPVADAFRIHGRRVLYNAVAEHQDASRSTALPGDHRFVGPLVRTEPLPSDLVGWLDRVDDRPHVYVALGTFLSYRTDVIARIAGALRLVGAKGAIAIGTTDPATLGPIPDDWIVARQLPQVALLSSADIAIHHGGNNSVQESLAAGVRQIVLPFSTDQFANAADLERNGAAAVLPPNDAVACELASAIDRLLASPASAPIARPVPEQLVRALQH
jgi:UDP:flavonoid glycosyltransferase YjiC (YdhE family)